jgi:putative membrane-bound dehydrogenase-like protein
MFCRLILLGSIFSFCVLAQVRTNPLPPLEEIKTFQLEPGLRVDLAAMEPITVAPVAISFDEFGRMYVAENRGYPDQADPAVGRIALLEDRDGDGYFETRHDFAKKLTFPNGVLAWNGGVIVTCAPEVLFLKDTDGNGQADERTVLLTGFAVNGSTQLRVSHPTFAPDNWIYLSGGLSGGKVSSPLRPKQPAIDIGRSEIRFRPDSGEFEAVDGKGQFGLTFDDFGHRFTCMNRVHIQHVVLSGKDLDRNPHLTFTDRISDVPENLDPGLKVGPPAARIYPISQNITTADSHEGTFTAACGVTVFRAGGLPKSMFGNVFSCDPAANVIHRDLLEQHGATFRARPATERSEFLASSDDWFRPVYLQIGPEGALYVCDMYRRTIEHPVYLPDEVRKRTDFQSGRDCGRIFRIQAKSKPKIGFVKLASARPALLVGALHHLNSSARDIAHRLLLERRPPEAAPLLRKLLNGQQAGQVEAGSRARALFLLHEFKELKATDLLKGLRDPHPGVREVAVRLTRHHSDPEVTSELLQLAADPDSHVRFETALVLPPTLNTVAARVRIVSHPESDRWTHAAILSSAKGLALSMAMELSSRPMINSKVLPFLTDVARIARKENSEAKLPGIANENALIQFAIVNGWFATERSELPSSGGDGHSLRDLFNQAITIARTESRSIVERELAVRFLGHAPSDFRSELKVLLNPAVPVELQHRAIETMLRGTTQDLFSVFEPAAWDQISPSVRERFVSGFLADRSLAAKVLAEIRAGNISASILSPNHRRTLRTHSDAALRSSVEELFASGSSADRHRIYEEWKSSLKLNADARNGQKVFARTCATCHRLDRAGVAVGPDLFSIRNQPKETILLHIIIPDLEISSGFNLYTVDLKNGQTLSGIIRSESGNALTLRTASGQDESVARADIVSIKAGELSMMPQDLDKTMTHQEMADLLAYLKGE